VRFFVRRSAWLSGFIDAEGCFMLTAEIKIDEITFKATMSLEQTMTLTQDISVVKRWFLNGFTLYLKVMGRSTVRKPLLL
jgi:hypothetical protein